MPLRFRMFFLALKGSVAMNVAGILRHGTRFMLSAVAVSNHSCACWCHSPPGVGPQVDEGGAPLGTCDTALLCSGAVVLPAELALGYAVPMVHHNLPISHCPEPIPGATDRFQKSGIVKIFQVPLNSTTSVKRLSPHQQGATWGLTIAHTKGLTIAHTKGLTIAHTKGLTTAHTKGLTTAHTKGLTIAHTKGLTTAHTKGLTTAHTKGLTTAHTKGLTTAHTKGLTIAQTKGRVRLGIAGVGTWDSRHGLGGPSRRKKIIQALGLNQHTAPTIHKEGLTPPQPHPALQNGVPRYRGVEGSKSKNSSGNHFLSQYDEYKGSDI